MYGQGGQIPVLILREGTQREKGRSAQSNNIAAAKAVADAVRTTLGPKGMDKMLVDSMGDVVITNDGVTILKEIDVAHPGAKMIVEVAKTQDQECGDGTTTAVVLTGELLGGAESLIEQKVHPTVITAGYRLAANKATEVLAGMGKKIGPKDRDRLLQIAATAMASKSASLDSAVLAKVAVDASLAVLEKVGDRTTVDSDDIQVVKKQGGSVADTEVVQGIILDKEVGHAGMPKLVKGAKIALIDGAFEIEKTEVEAKIQITEPKQLQAFLDQEEKTLRGYVASVKAAGANVIVCQKGIDDLVLYYLAKADIYAVRRATKSDMEKLAKATGGSIVSKIGDLKKGDLGISAAVEQRKIGDNQMTFVTGCKDAKAVSILIRGGTEHVVDEIERALEDALSSVRVALEYGTVTPGGGATAVELALALRGYASSVGGREQLAIEAFAAALEVIPRTLAQNAGLDPIDIVLDLRNAHQKGNSSAGLDLSTGKVGDMDQAHVIEPLRTIEQAIRGATEAAAMILRIDDIIASKSGGGGPGAGGPPGGMPPGMGGMGGMGGDF